MADFLPVKQQRPLVYINARAFKGTVRLRRYESAETVCSLKQCVGVFTRCCYSWVVGDCEQGASFLGFDLSVVLCATSSDRTSCANHKLLCFPAHTWNDSPLIDMLAR